MDRVVLAVPDMSCAGGLITIRMAVSQSQETAEVSSDFDSRELTVEYNSCEVTVEEIQQALASVGYDSSILDNPVVPGTGQEETIPENYFEHHVRGRGGSHRGSTLSAGSPRHLTRGDRISLHRAVGRLPELDRRIDLLEETID